MDERYADYEPKLVHALNDQEAHGFVYTLAWFDEMMREEVTYG